MVVINRKARAIWAAKHFINKPFYAYSKKGKKKVQREPQSQTAALPRRQEKEETDKSKQAQIEQTYEKH